MHESLFDDPHMYTSGHDPVRSTDHATLPDLRSSNSSERQRVKTSDTVYLRNDDRSIVGPGVEVQPGYSQSVVRQRAVAGQLKNGTCASNTSKKPRKADGSVISAGRGLRGREIIVSVSAAVRRPQRSTVKLTGVSCPIFMRVDAIRRRWYSDKQQRDHWEICKIIRIGGVPRDEQQ